MTSNYHRQFLRLTDESDFKRSFNVIPGMSYWNFAVGTDVKFPRLSVDCVSQGWANQFIKNGTGMDQADYDNGLRYGTHPCWRKPRSWCAASSDCYNVASGHHLCWVANASNSGEFDVLGWGLRRNGRRPARSRWQKFGQMTQKEEAWGKLEFFRIKSEIGVRIGESGEITILIAIIVPLPISLPRDRWSIFSWN